MRSLNDTCLSAHTSGPLRAFACARQRVAARCPSREGALLECHRAAFGCCIPALIAAHLHFAPSAVCRAVRIRGQESGSVGKNTTDPITEPDPMDGKDTHPALQQHDGVLTRRLRWAGRYFMSMRVADRMSTPFPNVRNRMSCTDSGMLTLIHVCCFRSCSGCA